MDQLHLFGAAGAPTRPRERAPRAADPLWDALCHVCKLHQASMTTSSRGITNRALKEIRATGATPGDVLERGRAYVERFRSTPTPQALARQWPGLATRPQATRPAAAALPASATPEQRSELAAKMRAWMEAR